VENVMASMPPQALRLTFAYQGSHIRLAGGERVSMIVPAPATAPPEAGQTGYWFTVQDAAGRVIYHRPLHSPIRVDVEAFSPDRQPTIGRVPLSEREGSFTVLVPDIANAHTFALHGPLEPGRPDEPASELLRVSIDVLRRTKPPSADGANAAQGKGR